jgi:hypothetical protein
MLNKAGQEAEKKKYHLLQDKTRSVPVNKISKMTGKKACKKNTISNKTGQELERKLSSLSKPDKNHRRRKHAKKCRRK